MNNSLTIFFLIHPAQYEFRACYFVASLREHLSPDIAVVAYCPQEHINDIDPKVLVAMERMNCDVRPITRPLEAPLVHAGGHKLLAALEPRESEYSCYLDVETLLLWPPAFADFMQADAIAAEVTAQREWPTRAAWEEAFKALSLPVPKAQAGAKATDAKKGNDAKGLVPLMSTEFFVFETNKGSGEKSFPEMWLDTALKLHVSGDDEAKPSLEHLAFSGAVARAQLALREIPRDITARLGEAEATQSGAKVAMIRYRQWDELASAGYRSYARQLCRKHAGARRPSWISLDKPFKKTDDAPVPKPEFASQTAAPKTVKTGRLDPSKARMAALTMVHEDYFFLEVWVRYWEAQIGIENLYILSHGQDPRIDKIARGATVVYIPNLSSARLDRQRWAAISDYVGGLTYYYNWIICNDVDEIVVLDPAVGGSIVEYLEHGFDGDVPSVISPFAVEIVHVPEREPELITRDAPILSQRPTYRINSNYAKPCIVRKPTRFSIGGHGSGQKNVRLDPNLYLMHLRYVDDGLSRARLEQRRTMIEERSKDSPGERSSTWKAGAAGFENVAKLPLSSEAFDHPEARKKMLEGRVRSNSGNWFFGPVRSKTLHTLPERFRDVF